MGAFNIHNSPWGSQMTNLKGIGFVSVNDRDWDKFFFRMIISRRFVPSLLQIDLKLVKFFIKTS